MNFYVGQKVVCLEDSIDNPCFDFPLLKGDIKTITGLLMCGCYSAISIGIKIKNSNMSTHKCNRCSKETIKEAMFLTQYFAPLEENKETVHNKADISFPVKFPSPEEVIEKEILKPELV